MLTGYTIELNEIEGITERQPESAESSETAKTTDTSALEDLFK
jgi:N utilization substance protein A